MADQVLHAGGEGNAIADGVDYNVLGWDFNDQVETDEVTSTKHYVPEENMTYKASEPTKRSGSGSFKFKYDSTNDPFPVMFPGKKITLKLYRAYLGSNINMPKALVTGMPIANGGVNGIFEITVNFESYGPYTMF